MKVKQNSFCPCLLSPHPPPLSLTLSLSLSPTLSYSLARSLSLSHILFSPFILTLSSAILHLLLILSISSPLYFPLPSPHNYYNLLIFSPCGFFFSLFISALCYHNRSYSFLRRVILLCICHSNSVTSFKSIKNILKNTFACLQLFQFSLLQYNTDLRHHNMQLDLVLKRVSRPLNHVHMTILNASILRDMVSAL